MKWRVGRKLGRTLYRGDECVGMVDTPEIAAQIVKAMNEVMKTSPHRFLYVCFIADIPHLGLQVTYEFSDQYEELMFSTSFVVSSLEGAAFNGPRKVLLERCDHRARTELWTKLLHQNLDIYIEARLQGLIDMS